MAHHRRCLECCRLDGRGHFSVYFSFAQPSTGSNLFSLPTGRDLKEESLKKKAASVDHRRRQTTEQLEYLACMGKAHGSGCPQNRPPSFATGCQQAGCGRVTPAPKRLEQRSQGVTPAPSKNHSKNASGTHDGMSGPCRRTKWVPRGHQMGTSDGISQFGTAVS